MKQGIGSLLILFILAGCTTTYQQSRSSPGDAAAVIPASSKVYIGMPRDGRYGQTVYHGSGAMTSGALVTAFASAVKNVKQSPDAVDRESGLRQARAGGFDYYVSPRILHWEDRATEWSGRSDIIIIQITVLNAATGAEIDSATISGKSKWFTFGGDSPQDMLAEPINKYVAELVR